MFFLIFSLIWQELFHELICDFLLLDEFQYPSGVDPEK